MTRSRGRWTAGLAAAAALAGVLTVRAHAPEPWTEEERVLLAVFEREVPRAREAFAGEDLLVCLYVDAGEAPRDAGGKMVEALPHGQDVRQGAHCEARGDGAVELSTQAPAVTLTAGPVEWIAEDEAWVRVRRFRDRGRIVNLMIRVVREHHRWTALGPILKQSPA